MDHSGSVTVRRGFSGVFSGSAAVREAEQKAAQYIQTLELTPLGGGTEVGRSCLILRYRGKTIMLDCGVLPSFTGIKALPYLSEINPKDIDIVIITHFHLDHAAALPYFTERMAGFRGRIFATHPTIAVMKIMLSDYVRVSTLEASDPDSLYSEADIDACLSKIEAVDLHSKIDVDGVKLQFFNAGHVLGAAMVLIDIAGVRLLYTGDYSCEDDRHLMAAEIPRSVPVDVLVVESTHGMTMMEPRAVREGRFTAAVERVVRRGGRCLIPVFALGPAQELMLILDELWGNKPDLQHVPIYYANRLASRGLEVYKTYVSYMNERIQGIMGAAAFDEESEGFRNPWDFRFVKKIRGRDDFRDTGPCVVFASPGMLQHGFSRELFDRWCEDVRNGVILSGYSTEGSLAKDLESNPSEVVTMSNRRVHRRITIDRISFSAHADAAQTSAFVDAIRPPSVILVHGEKTEMSGLHSTLNKKYHGITGFNAFMPQNGTTVALPYEDEVVVRILGSLAAKRIAAGMKISGVLVQHNYKHLLIAPSELPKYTEAVSYTIRQKQHVPYRGTYEVLTEVVRAMFAESIEALYSKSFKQLSRVEVEELDDASCALQGLHVSEAVAVVHAPPDRVVLTWHASPTTDMIAAALVTLLAQSETDIAGVRRALLLDKRARTGRHSHEHHHHHETSMHDETANVVASDTWADDMEKALYDASPYAYERCSRILRSLATRYRQKNVHVQRDTEKPILGVCVKAIQHPGCSLRGYVTCHLTEGTFDTRVELDGSLPPFAVEYQDMFATLLQQIVEESAAGLEPLHLGTA